MRITRILIAGAVAVAMTPMGPADAYYYLSGCSQPGTYVSGKRQIKFLASDLTGYTTLSPNSAGRWNSAASTMSFVAASTNYAVYASESNFGATGYDGITYPGDCGTDGLTVPITQAWGNTYYMGSYTNGKRYSVMVHELGHALGLAHNEEHGNCTVVQIMYSSSSRYDNCGIEYPKSDDIAGVNSLY